MLAIFWSIVLPGYSQIDTKSVVADVTKELKLPTRKQAGKKQLAGTYSFVVEIDGTLGDVAVKDSMGHGVDEQIVNQLKQTKGWKVVMVDGKGMRVAYSLPITVLLDKK